MRTDLQQLFDDVKTRKELKIGYCNNRAYIDHWRLTKVYSKFGSMLTDAKEYIRLKQEFEKLKKKLETLKSILTYHMRKEGVSCVKFANSSVCCDFPKKPRTWKRFNLAQFLLDHPELKEEIKKYTTITKSSQSRLCVRYNKKSKCDYFVMFPIEDLEHLQEDEFEEEDENFEEEDFEEDA